MVPPYARVEAVRLLPRLGPLSRDEVAKQVTGLMGAPPPAGVADEVYARSEGNPFLSPTTSSCRGRWMRGSPCYAGAGR